MSKLLENKLHEIDEELCKMIHLVKKEKISDDELIAWMERVTAEAIAIGNVIPGGKEEVSGLKENLQRLKTLLGKTKH
jgi:hypothetical protein